MSTTTRTIAPSRAVSRAPGGLRKPARVTVDARELDELRIEHAALRHDATEACDYLEPRLSFMYPISIELGPPAEQLVAGCLNRVARLRRQAAS